jgi:predicted site-specific integrase-resolvase
MITLPGLAEPLYQPLDAQNYCGVSAQTLAKWRREGFLKPAAAVGRGYLYTKAALDECLSSLNYDRWNTHVEVIYHG